MVPPTYAPPTSPYNASTPQPSQPPQLTSSVEQAILNLSNLVDNFIEKQRAVNVKANQEIDIVESSLSKELDGFQSEIDKKFDILQQFISNLTNQLVHQEEENLEEECLIDTTVEEQCKQQDEAISPLLTEEGSGRDPKAYPSTNPHKFGSSCHRQTQKQPTASAHPAFTCITIRTQNSCC